MSFAACGLKSTHGPRVYNSVGGSVADALVTTVEGPLGKADLYEIMSTRPNGTLMIEYEVRSGGDVQRFAALGAAYIVAGELTGSPT
jgi:hypothetical protein